MEKIQDSIKIKGRITVRGYKAGTIAKVQPLVNELKRVLSLKSGNQAIKNKLRADIARIFEMGKLSEVSNHNLVMSAANIGKDLIVQALNGFLVTPVYNLGINYIAIGTGNTAPAITDTQLTAETARSVVVYTQDVNFNELILQAFFPDANLANGTYKEVGSFVGATGVANSGQIFNHALLGMPYSKNSGQDTTIEVSITIS